MNELYLMSKSKTGFKRYANYHVSCDAHNYLRNHVQLHLVV